MSSSQFQYIADTIRVNDRLGTAEVYMFNGSGATIPAKAAIQVDLSVTTHGVGVAIKEAAIAGVNPGMVCGASEDDIPDGKWGWVRVLGNQDGIECDAGVAAGDSLVGSTANAGKLMEQPGAWAQHLNQRVAIALGAVAGGVVDVRWLDPMGLASRKGAA